MTSSCGVQKSWGGTYGIHIDVRMVSIIRGVTQEVPQGNLGDFVVYLPPLRGARPLLLTQEGFSSPFPLAAVAVLLTNRSLSTTGLFIVYFRER